MKTATTYTTPPLKINTSPKRQLFCLWQISEHTILESNSRRPVSC